MRMYNEDLRRYSVRRGTLVCIKGCKKRIGRPKLTWMEVVRRDMEKLGITSHVTLDRNNW